VNEEKILQGVRLILEGLGVDPDSENFQDTPRRVLDFLRELREPKITDDDYVRFTSAGNLVVARNICVYSLCPHHLLPTIYDIDLAYIPNGKVVGISKLARLAADTASKLLLQEDFTEEVADRLVELTQSKDVMVIVRGRHLCMIMRGVRQENSQIVTSALRGEFKTNPNPRMEVLALLEGGMHA
jgi:GTP cyclohydrolase I